MDLKEQVVLKEKIKVRNHQACNVCYIKTMLAVTGLVGRRGLPGRSGLTGQSGMIGSKGVIGSHGSEGDEGDQGRIGNYSAGYNRLYYYLMQEIWELWE